MACVFAAVVSLAPGVRAITPTALLNVRLPKTPVPAKSISVIAVAVETGQVLASLTATSANSQVTLTVRAVPQVVFADWLLSDGKSVSGHSPLLRPVAGRTLTVDLSPRRAAGTFPAMSNAAYRLPGFFASTAEVVRGATLIGVPANGFTVKGLDLTGVDVARSVTTEMIKGAHCYGEDGGFVVVETDPEVLAILKAEIDLSNSPPGDPSSRMTNRYVAPSRSVSGSWSSDGTNVTVTLRVVDSQGRELLNKSATGALNHVLDINASVASALAAAMSCSAPSDPLLGWLLYFEVTITGEASETKTDSSRSVDKAAWKIDRKYSGTIELRRPTSRSMMGWRANLTPRDVPIDVSIQDEIIHSVRSYGEGDSWEAVTTTQVWRGVGLDSVGAGSFLFQTNPKSRTYNIEIPLNLASRWSGASLLLAFEKKEEVEHTPYGYGPGPTHYTKVLENKKLGLGTMDLPVVNGLLEHATIRHPTDLLLDTSSNFLEFDSGIVRPSAPFLSGLPKVQDNLRIRVYYRLTKLRTN